MASTTFSLSNDNKERAVLSCNGDVVTVEFISGMASVGGRRFSRLKATRFGEQVYETGNWDDFTLGGIDVASIKELGKRLKEFALTEP